MSPVQAPASSSLPNDRTPTGTQSASALFQRRLLIVFLNVLAYFALIYAFSGIAGAGGWSIVDVLMMLCVIVATPWTVLGFWNSLIGLWLLHGRKDGVSEVLPLAAAGKTDAPLYVRTAILLTLRNEDPARAIQRLRIVEDSVERAGFGGQFDYFILSDTNNPDVFNREDELVKAWAAKSRSAIHYRRRTDNVGYKAGNVRDFCATWGGNYELMLPLDADSLMDGETIVGMVRIMQANPKLGILQSLVVGMPSQSAFARIFQFGMRHGMRAYTMGQAWWVGDCGPFWGHNALVRIKPFYEQCELPVLPGKPPLGGHVLSHDQVEATMMRRAGYEVRVLPEEGGSWEENPPTILTFTGRDLRWCQGNLQYLRLLDLPGLYPISRFQLVWAILMFIGIPAWTLLILLAALKPYDGEAHALFPTGGAIALYVLFLLMSLSPKLCGLVDILLEDRAVTGALHPTPLPASGAREPLGAVNEVRALSQTPPSPRENGEMDGVRGHSRTGTARYGGTDKFLKSAAIEIVFSFLLGAVSTFRTTLFMIGLAFGKSVIWSGQARDAHGISLATAFAGLWPQLAYGVVVLGLMANASLSLALWSLPLTAGFILAIPFAIWTANPANGAALARAGLCAIPEEIETPPEIAAVQGRS